MTASTKVLQVKLRSFLRTVESEMKEATELVSSSLATHYNQLRSELAKNADLAPHMPPEIGTRSHFPGCSEATFIDLRVYLQQLVDVADLLENSHAA